MNYHLDKKLNPAYADPYGTWQVTTDGDCEGKSTYDLGTYVGYIDEITLKLADKCFYTLTFTAAKQLPETPTRSKVQINLDIDSGTWNMNLYEKLNVYRKIFNKRPIYVTEGEWGVQISTFDEEHNAKQILREQALSKLTEEEREALLG